MRLSCLLSPPIGLGPSISFLSLDFSNNPLNIPVIQIFINEIIIGIVNKSIRIIFGCFDEYLLSTLSPQAISICACLLLSSAAIASDVIPSFSEDCRDNFMKLFSSICSIIKIIAPASSLLFCLILPSLENWHYKLPFCISKKQG